jgi:hypothetical protein
VVIADGTLSFPVFRVLIDVSLSWGFHYSKTHVRARTDLGYNIFLEYQMVLAVLLNFLRLSVAGGKSPANTRSRAGGTSGGNLPEHLIVVLLILLVVAA